MRYSPQSQSKKTTESQTAHRAAANSRASSTRANANPRHAPAPHTSRNPSPLRRRQPAKPHPHSRLPPSRQELIVLNTVVRKIFAQIAPQLLRSAQPTPVAAPPDSEAYSCSGASSTAVPRFENTSLCRKPEQGRENRHPDYNLPQPPSSPSSSARTLSGTHPFAARPLQQHRPRLRNTPRPQRQNHIPRLRLPHQRTPPHQPPTPHTPPSRRRQPRIAFTSACASPPQSAPRSPHRYPAPAPYPHP